MNKPQEIKAPITTSAAEPELTLIEVEAMFSKLERDLLGWVRNKADREYTAATLAKFGQRVVNLLKKTMPTPSLPIDKNTPTS